MSNKINLCLERCSISEAQSNQLLKSLTQVKQLTLNEMGLSAEHIQSIPKLLETSNQRSLKVLYLRQNNIGIDGAMCLA